MVNKTSCFYHMILLVIYLSNPNNQFIFQKCCFTKQIALMYSYPFNNLLIFVEKNQGSRKVWHHQGPGGGSCTGLLPPPSLPMCSGGHSTASVKGRTSEGSIGQSYRPDYRHVGRLPELCQSLDDNLLTVPQGPTLPRSRNF